MTLSHESAVSLREVTKETLLAVLDLKIAEGQERFVASNAVSIAQAHFHEVAWFRAIHADEKAIGFVMLADMPGTSQHYLWRFMIDRSHQRQGFGRRAMELVIEHVRSLPGKTELLLSHGKAEGGPGPFYEGLGFEYTGDEDDGELVMRLDLGPRSQIG